MSKFVKVMIALLAITALVAPAVFAEDRLALNGELRVRGYMTDNYQGFNDDAPGNTSDWFDQRFRLGGTIAVSEGVKIDFRYDLWDGTWGNGNNDLTDADNRAYLTIDKETWKLSAGKQFYSLGNAIAIDQNGNQFIFTYKPLGLELGYLQDYEGATNYDDDIQLYSVALKNSTDLYSGTIFAALMTDGNDYDDSDPADAIVDYTNGEVYLIGAAADFNLDAAKVGFEINYFDGSFDGVNGSEDVDLKGIQFYLDGSMAISETTTVGANFTYAKGYNDDDEAQIYKLTEDDSWLPETYGSMATLFAIYPGETFDPTGDNLGQIGVQVYTSVKLSDAFSVKATVFYTETEEDYTAAQKLVDDTAYESFLGGVLSSTYDIAKGAAIDTSIAYTTVDAANSLTEDDPSLCAAFRLRVRF